SIQGQELCKSAEEMKEGGSQALQDGKYPLAFAIATQVLDNEEQSSDILSRSSYICILMVEYEKATIIADVCISINPSWHKGYYMKMQVMKATGKVQDAVKLGIHILKTFTLHKDEELTVLKDIAKMIGESSTCKANTVQLSSLMEVCSPKEWTEWGEKLVIDLIQRRIPLASLDPNGKHPLHAALKMAIKTGSHGLLEYLFQHYIPTGDRNRMDDDQNTLLHLACKGSYQSQDRMISLLLKNNVDPTIKNKAGLLPVELLLPNSSCVALLQETKENKGMSMTSLNKSEVKKQEICENYQDIYTTDDVQESDQTNLKCPQTQTFIATKKENVPILKSPPNIKQWRASDITKWLEENQLDFMKPRLKGASGAELIELWLMLKTAPKYFYRSLPQQIGVSCDQLLKLSTSL
ncbi:hypothetical protein LSH36_12g03059, partial [Paralvinella palmiformis]